MALDEADRFRITTKLADTLGQDDAAALMETIPPFDWHQIVTKTDLTNAVKDLATKSDMALEFSTLREEMGIKFSQVDARFARVDAQLAKLQSALHMWTVVSSKSTRNYLTSEPSCTRLCAFTFWR